MRGTIGVTELARTLGVPTRTVRRWCATHPGFAVRRNGQYFIKIATLRRVQGVDPLLILTAESHNWVKAVDLARVAGVSRQTMARWCKTRPWFAHRVGRNWYVSMEMLGVHPDNVDLLRKKVAKS
jgi:hypothetical protein